MKTIITLWFILLTLVLSAQLHKPKTIVGIFAHPDDENMIGDVLAKYARLGNKVYVIIATDGKDGTRVTKIPAGDSLGNIRKEESRCACKKLGIEPPIFLSIDRLDTKIGVRNYLNGHKKFRELLKSKFLELNPDILITFGPDGEYGHSEHIVAGATVTELLLKEGWVHKYPLYYFGWTKQQVTDDDLSYIDKKYFNVSVKYEEEDEQRSFEAAKCYVTQTTAQEIKETIERETKDKTNTVYFRRFYVKNELKAEF